MEFTRRLLIDQVQINVYPGKERDISNCESFRSTKKIKLDHLTERIDLNDKVVGLM